ncbi:MAG: HNH endonuclease [Candidatus Aminicenantes bacterium]|nr:HNH endonuclease [Candidatus Aminicenantes bacterium]
MKKNPDPSGDEIRNRPYWRSALDDLYRSYSRICAYSALWCSPDAAQVDHFIPIASMKGENSRLAYDWNNYRLASKSMNTQKHCFQDVIDPFLVERDWFVMDFPSLDIRCGDGLSEQEKQRVQATIDRLKLNKKTEYKEYRQSFLLNYCRRCKVYMAQYPGFAVGLELGMLEEVAPFMTYELKRQGLEIKIIEMMTEDLNLIGSV